MDRLLLAFRAQMDRADEGLAALTLTRSHHRVLYVLARQSALSTGELTQLVGVRKQWLTIVIGDLLGRQYVVQRPGRIDKRRTATSLTELGQAVEAALFQRFVDGMAIAYAAAGPDAVGGYLAVLESLPGELQNEDCGQADARLFL